MVFSIYNSISVLINEGKGTFEDGIWTSVTGGGGCGVAADFNGDGRPDLAVTNVNGVSILLGTGTASKPYSLGTTIALADAECLVTGDLNGDGIPDLLVSVNGTVVGYLGNGNGTFTLTSTTATPSGYYLALGDFNHDGKLDFALATRLRTVTVTGPFRHPWILSPTRPPRDFPALRLVTSITTAGLIWCYPTTPFLTMTCSSC
jgi:hypothetical protein